jgi:5-methyltetrahydropteroyltriglutamate--homocysteine methyltransferase
MMALSTPDLRRLRVDQVGSLLRPEALKTAVGRLHAGEITVDELRVAQDAAVREVVTRQEAVGFPVVTDGEFRRINFQDSFGESVSGYGGTERAILSRVPAVQRLARVRNQPLDEYRFACGLTDRPVKVTMVSVDRVTQRFAWEDSRSVYPSVEEFVEDAVRIEREMLGEVAAAGCRYVQIDGPGYTAYLDPPSLAEWRERGEDPDANLDRAMAADNAVIAGFPGVTFGIHLCRGNNAADTPQARQGHYDAIAERLFNTLSHDRFLLEYDTERAGSFEPLRFVPKGKMVVLGLVSTKLSTMETIDELKRRVNEASRYLPLDQLALGPQCGFASRINLGPNRMSIDDQWRKLERVRVAAEQIWGTI